MFMDLLNRVEPGLLIILLSPINWEGVLTCSYVSQPNDSATFPFNYFFFFLIGEGERVIPCTEGFKWLIVCMITFNLCPRYSLNICSMLITYIIK